MQAKIIAFTPRHRRISNDALAEYLPYSPWPCPDLMSRRDMIGFHFSHPIGPDHLTEAAVNPPEWGIRQIADVLARTGNDADAEALAHRAHRDTRVLALWRSPKLRSGRPDGILLHRFSGGVNAQGELSEVNLFLDYCWLDASLRGQKYSHYFACYLRAFVYWHPIHPWYAQRQLQVAPTGFAMRIIAAQGSPAWERLSHNVLSVFKMNRSMWVADQLRGNTLITPYMSRWAINKLVHSIPIPQEEILS